MKVKMNDLISVIVPIYNVEAYLEECLDSICGQTYKNLEILLINDGSTDGSRKIAQKYAERDNRVVLYDTEISGVSAARNMGIKRASGKYISFVDSDDVISENFIYRLYELIYRYKADIAQCGFVRDVESSVLRNYHGRVKVKCFSGVDMQLQLFNSKTEVSAVVLWNKLYDRKILQNIEFPIGKVHEDDAVIYKIYNNATNIVVTNEKKYFYRLRKGSIVARTENKKIFDKKDNYKEKLDFYERIHNPKLYDLTLKRYCYTLKACKDVKPENSSYGSELRVCKRKALRSKHIGLKGKLGILFL